MKIKASDVCVDAAMEYLLLKEVVTSKVQRRSFIYSPEIVDHLERCKKCRGMLPVYLELRECSIEVIERGNREE